MHTCGPFPINVSERESSSYCEPPSCVVLYFRFSGFVQRHIQDNDDTESRPSGSSACRHVAPSSKAWKSLTSSTTKGLFGPPSHERKSVHTRRSARICATTKRRICVSIGVHHTAHGDSQRGVCEATCRAPEAPRSRVAAPRATRRPGGLHARIPPPVRQPSQFRQRQAPCARWRLIPLHCCCQAR